MWDLDLENLCLTSLAVTKALVLFIDSKLELPKTLLP